MSTPITNPSITNPSTTTPPLRPLYLALALTCPLLIALPPRKLDFYTFTLSGLFVFSAQELAFGDARRAATQRAGSTGVMGVLGRGDVDADGKGGGTVPLPGVEAGVGPAELLRRKEGRGKGEGVVGMAKDLWMGDEEAGWKERRVAEERERLEGGEGYWDLILGQVREAFGRDRSTGERVGEGGETEGREGR